MKNLLFGLLICSVLVITSCKDDYECTVAGVAGSYMGTDACDSNNVHSEVISFAATANANEIEVTTDEGLTFTVALDNCKTATFVEMNPIGADEKEYDFEFTETTVKVKTKTTTLGLFGNTCERELDKQ